MSINIEERLSEPIPDDTFYFYKKAEEIEFDIGFGSGSNPGPEWIQIAIMMEQLSQLREIKQLLIRSD